MLDQQIESASNKLIQFIQDLTVNLQTIFTNQIDYDQSFLDLFQLRSDYAQQLASLFDMLINEVIEEFLPTRTLQLTLNLDPVQIWRLIQSCIDQLNQIQCQDLHLIMKHLRTINKYFYNLLLQLKNVEYLKVDQIRSLYQNLTEELYYLSKSLLHFTSIFHTKTQEFSNPIDVSPIQYSNNNNHINETMSNVSPAMNTNYYPCYTTNQPPPQQSDWNDITRGFCCPPNPIRCPTPASAPITGIFSQPKSMGCGVDSHKNASPPPLCFSTPVVYTPEMEALFSSGGIIYARKSGNTWIAENLGTLIETLKDIGQTIDMNEHCEILVRKTGELYVRRKKGRRKRVLQENLSKPTPRGNNAYVEMNVNQNESSDSNISAGTDDDDD